MKIIDKNQDYYDYLSHSPDADDLITFDRRGSKNFTKEDFCKVLHDIKYESYKTELSRYKFKYKKGQNPYFEIALAAGTNLFIIHLKNLIYKEMLNEENKKVNVLVNFTPVLVCTRKYYEYKGKPLCFYNLDTVWRTGRFTYEYKRAWDINSEQSWEMANLNNVRFKPLFDFNGYPLLYGSGISGIIDPSLIYNGIEEYLFGLKNDTDCESKGLTDKERIINHGFDLKDSFRKESYSKKNQ